MTQLILTVDQSEARVDSVKLPKILLKHFPRLQQNNTHITSHNSTYYDTNSQEHNSTYQLNVIHNDDILSNVNAPP